jgi:hypothetical protein
MPLSRGIPLSPLTPIRLSAHSGSLYLSAIVVFFFSHLPYSYTNVLNYPKFHTWSDRRCQLEALFLLNVFTGSKFYPIILEIVGLRMPNRNFGDFKLFHADFCRRNCPSARRTSAANRISSDSCTFNCRPILINDLLPVFRVQGVLPQYFYITFSCNTGFVLSV